MASKKKPQKSTDTAKKQQTKATKGKQLEFDDLEKEQSDSKLFMAVYFIMFLVFCVFSFIGGTETWLNVRSYVFSFFGVSIYIFDVMLLVLGIISALNNVKNKYIKRNIGLGILIVSFSAFVQVISTSSSSASEGFGSLFSYAFDSGKSIPADGFTLTGGILGGLFGNGLQVILGKPVTLILYFLLIIVSLVLVFNISVKAVTEKISGRINNGKERSDAVAEELKEKREMKRERRRDIRTAKAEQRQIEARKKELERRRAAEAEAARRRAELERLKEETISPFPSKLEIEPITDFEDDIPSEAEAEASDDEIPTEFVDVSSGEDKFEDDSAQEPLGSVASNIPLNPINNTAQQSDNDDGFIRVRTSTPIVGNSSSGPIAVKPEGVISSETKSTINIRPIDFDNIPTNDIYDPDNETDIGADAVIEGKHDVDGEIISRADISKNQDHIVVGVKPKVIVPRKKAKKEDIDETSAEDKEAEQIINDAAASSKTLEEENRRQVSEFKNTNSDYLVPPIDCLNEPDGGSETDHQQEMQEISQKLIDTLKSFGVETKMLGASRGPSVTRYELQPAMGVRINKITNLSDDIALNLATTGIRMEAPIPGMSAVGIEIPNKVRSTVTLREIISSDEYQKGVKKSKLNVALGKDISGQVNCADLAKMPHMLVAGTTGSGKSVTMNCMIVSLLYNASPEDVKILLIDPKQVEFAVYNGIPHLYVPVISDARKASGALTWAVTEMERRYKLFSIYGVRDLASYNKYAENHPEKELTKEPQAVIFIDELADLMMVSPKEVEDAICRLAQKARAAGMHLVVATQRPSVDVVTGLIKANIPSRLALSVSSQVDSRTIIDTAGAEKLLGNGDMLFNPVGVSKPVRIQGAFVSDEEIERIVDFLKDKTTPEYNDSIMADIDRYAAEAGCKKGSSELDEAPSASGGKVDALFDDVLKFACENKEISGSLIMRKFSLGYGRSAKIIDQMAERGYLGETNTSTKKRPVLISLDQYYEQKALQEASGGTVANLQSKGDQINMFDEDVADSFDILSDDEN